MRRSPLNRNTSRMHHTLASVALLGALHMGAAVQTATSQFSEPLSCRAPILVEGKGVQEASPPHWILTAPAEEWREMQRWCAAVGAPAAAVGDSLPVRVDSLLVATWNVYLGGGDVRAFVNDLRAGRLTDGAPVDHFALLIQEAYRDGSSPELTRSDVRVAPRVAPSPPTGTREDVMQTARALGLHVLFLPSMRNGRPGRDPAEDRGNAILSTLPLENPAFLELPLERQRRTAVVATVRGEGSDGAEWTLRLANVHLDNRSRPDRLLDWFGAARLRQAYALTGALAHERSIIVGGDLNSWSHSRFEQAPAHLREHFGDVPDDLTRTLTMLGVLGRRLDHIMGRLPEGRASTPVTVDNRYGSDHHPVMTWVVVAVADELVSGR